MGKKTGVREYLASLSGAKLPEHLGFLEAMTR
jgi:hypothetical protein